MDLQAAQFTSLAGQEVRTRATLSWLDWQLPLFVALCAIGGAILFTFLVRIESNITFPVFHVWDSSDIH